MTKKKFQLRAGINTVLHYPRLYIRLDIEKIVSPFRVFVWSNAMKIMSDKNPGM